MISKTEFQRRVKENSRYFAETYATSVDAAAYHLYDAQRGEVRPMMLLDKVYDIFAAVSIGALAVTARDGADAMMQMSGNIIPIELKFVKIESSSFQVGPRGGIYKGGRNSRATLQGCMQAQYTINNDAHLQTKNRYTVMVVYDQTTGMFVEARGITGSTALEKLSNQRTSHRMFYWDTFLEHGRRIPLVVPSLGYDGLVRLIQENNR